MPTSTWVLDPSHSEVGFRVKHMMFTTVSGKFTTFTVSRTGGDDDVTQSVIAFDADTASVDTGNGDRDKHLRSADFFDAENFPKLTFRSTSIEKSGDAYLMHGNLTIRKVTRPIALRVEHSGRMKDPWGNIKEAFAVEGKINRKDFDLNWNAALEAGGLLVAEEVKLTAEVQLVLHQG